MEETSFQQHFKERLRTCKVLKQFEHEKRMLVFVVDERDSDRLFVVSEAQMWTALYHCV